MSSGSSRRRFLTGGAVLDGVRARGGELADALAPAESLPFSGDTMRLETRGMACPWGVVLDPGPPERTLVASEALREVQRLELLLSVYRPDSPVSRLNRDAATSPQGVDEELLRLLDLCRELWASTGGAFDPATQALLELWRECRQAVRVPAENEVEAALAVTGLGRVQWRRAGGGGSGGALPGEAGSDGAAGVVQFDAPGVGLNFGAVGKGYALDCVSGKLRAGGIESFLVHGGYSSVIAAGGHYGQPGWPVGLKNPLFTEESYLLLLLGDQALGTSGSNIQYFRHGGRRYGHILDPRSGWPAEALLSVSVVAPTAAQADALSTAFYVLGLEKALEYCHTHPEVGAVLTPPAERGRSLSPVVCNLRREQVFVASDAVEVQWTGGAFAAGSGTSPAFRPPAGGPVAEERS